MSCILGLAPEISGWVTVLDFKQKRGKFMNQKGLRIVVDLVRRKKA